jgi:tRNA nucleotidyltransferase (CCA-adding enzyme)
MEIYLVGGALRDEFLGKEVTEKDWVVVGGTVEAMLAAGYRQVGRAFPVFLHPQTGEEYALARTERKTGPGHTGFEVHADQSVTLAEDLARRDLTINAMARGADGVLVDPFNGRADLDARILRHVSAAFTEDPLRVFRVARFAACLPEFRVAAETVGLIREMNAAGALIELSAERVQGELVKALRGVSPERFITELRDWGALDPWLIEFADVEPVTCTGLESDAQRFAAWASGLSEAAAVTLGGRLKVPRAHLSLTRWIARHGRSLAGWPRVPAEAVYQALTEIRGFKEDGELAAGLELVEVLFDVELSTLADAARTIRREVTGAALIDRGLAGQELGRVLEAERVAALDRVQLQVRDSRGSG